LQHLRLLRLRSTNISCLTFKRVAQHSDIKVRGSSNCRGGGKGVGWLGDNR
jgi:hypothetical protein